MGDKEMCENVPKSDLETKGAEGEEKVEQITDIVGDWGQWQKNIFFFYLTIAVFSAFNNMGLSLMAPKLDFWCRESEGEEKNGTRLQCFKNEAKTEPCNSWEFDTSFYSKTITSEWDLVCSRSWLISLTQSFYMAGMIVSSLVCGHLSDKYGRLPVLSWSMVIEVASGVVSAFSPSVYLFMAARFFIAIGAYGRYLTGFMLVMETTAIQYRATNGIMCRLGWALGYFMLPGLALIFRNFRHFALACSVPELLWFLWLTRLPESPRWQMATDQKEKARAALKKAALINGKPMLDIDHKLDLFEKNFKEQKEDESHIKKPNFLDLWKTPKLRKNSLILCFTWFTTGFVYYGLSLNIGDLGGHLVLNFAIAGLLEFPAFGLSIYALKKFSRRTVQAYIMFGAAVGSFLAIPFYIWPVNASVNIALGMVVKFCLSCSWNVIYVYSAEIYPTVVRQVGVGSNSAAARVGAVMAPFIKEVTQYSHISVSLGIFGVISALNGIAVLFLPETKYSEIPDTIEEAEAEHRK